jgi:hypothetical protein
MTLTPAATVSCPYCKGILSFRSSGTDAVMCSRCSVMANRNGQAFKVKVSNVMPEDMTPLQIGTTGIFGNINFEIIGRVRFQYKQKYKNQWQLLFPDGTSKLLAEACGAYAFYSPDKTTVNPQTLKNITAGKRIDLPGGSYYIESLAKCENITAEGEVTFNPLWTEKFISVTFSLPGSPMAVAEIFSKEKTALFKGTYQDFDDFNFKNLRDLNGWN